MLISIHEIEAAGENSQNTSTHSHQNHSVDPGYYKLQVSLSGKASAGYPGHHTNWAFPFYFLYFFFALWFEADVSWEMIAFRRILLLNDKHVFFDSLRDKIFKFILRSRF